MKRWQVSEASIADLEQALNELEADGWHVFQVVSNGAQYFLVISYRVENE